MIEPVWTSYLIISRERLKLNIPLDVTVRSSSGSPACAGPWTGASVCEADARSPPRTIADCPWAGRRSPHILRCMGGNNVSSGLFCC